MTSDQGSQPYLDVIRCDIRESAAVLDAALHHVGDDAGLVMLYWLSATAKSGGMCFAEKRENPCLFDFLAAAYNWVREPLVPNDSPAAVGGQW